MNETRETLAGKWVRLGVMFNNSAAEEMPDVERLLLETARHAGKNIAAFEAAVAWLACYGEYVAKHRLAHLIRVELEIADRAVMGLMLDLAKEYGLRNANRFNAAIAVCGKPTEAFPLLDVMRRNGALLRLAEESASPLSRKWGRWIEAFEPRSKILRSRSWIVKMNPLLAVRALVGGDLVASVLAEGAAGPGGFASELEVARRCGVTRAAAHHAIERLELAGLATRHQVERGMRQGGRIEIHARQGFQAVNF